MTAPTAATRTVDVAILGAGSAGLSAFRAARRHTDSVLLIDPGPLGTTCARVGCMPSKLLIAAADAAHAVREAGRFGIDVGIDTGVAMGIATAGLRIDGVRVMQRVRAERDRFVGFVLDDLQALGPEHLLRGRARFVAAAGAAGTPAGNTNHGTAAVHTDHGTSAVRSKHSTLAVDTDGGTLHVRARRVVIATGSRPEVPAAWRAALGDRLVVNDDVFDWTDLPESVAVIGSGVVGLELALALHRLGVRVRLLGRTATVGPLTDPVLARLCADLFDAALPLHREAEVIGLQRICGGGRGGDDQAELRWRTPAGARDADGDEHAGDNGHAERTDHAGHAEHAERFERVLVAIGRRPNLDGLGLEALGLSLDAHGRLPHDRRTGLIEQSGALGEAALYIAGDAGSERPLLHEAADDGLIAGDNAGRHPHPIEHPRRTPLAIVFSDPQIMLAGASHRELVAAGTRFTTGRVGFADQGRSRVMARNAGALHVYADSATQRLLGAEMIGPAAEHLGHLLAWSIGLGATVDSALAQPVYHPVIEEGLRSALRDCQRALTTPAPCEGCTPGG